ncbi:MAG: hypothetical protein QOE64_1946, partial [Frankiales bacterium]|nr:hypothetical protein [Frankiales bacterium]
MAGLFSSACCAPAALGADQQVTAQRSLYQSPTITTSDDGTTTIGIREESAGLFLRYTLDPVTVYRVTVSGEVLSGQVTQRIGLDGDLTYEPAPQGSISRTVTGRSALELLFYSDTPATYRIDSVTVQACDDCRTDDDLRHQILSEIPGLAGLTQTDPEEAAERIMRWAAPQIPFADAFPAPILTDVLSVSDLYYENFKPL